MMSTKYRYLNCGLLISVLFLTFAPTADADSAKEQLQGTSIASSKFSGPYEARGTLSETEVSAADPSDSL
jgi:hypothetical protein